MNGIHPPRRTQRRRTPTTVLKKLGRNVTWQANLKSYVGTELGVGETGLKLSLNLSFGESAETRDVKSLYWHLISVWMGTFVSINATKHMTQSRPPAGTCNYRDNLCQKRLATWSLTASTRCMMSNCPCLIRPSCTSGRRNRRTQEHSSEVTDCFWSPCFEEKVRRNNIVIAERSQAALLTERKGDLK